MFRIIKISKSFKIISTCIDYPITGMMCVVRNVAVLLADNTFVLAAFHLLLLFVAIGLLLLYFIV
jgi:hypothetical protein